MKRMKFFGLLAAIMLLAFGLALGCDNGTTSGGEEPVQPVVYRYEDPDNDILILFSSEPFAARATLAGPEDGDYYEIRRLSDETILLSSGQIAKVGKAITFTQDDGVVIQGEENDDGGLSLLGIPDPANPGQTLPPVITGPGSGSGGNIVNPPPSGGVPPAEPTETGANVGTLAIADQWITSNSIWITTPATIASPNTGTQVPEYAITGLNATPSAGDWKQGPEFTGLIKETQYLLWVRSKATSTYKAGAAVSFAFETAEEGAQGAVVKESEVKALYVRALDSEAGADGIKLEVSGDVPTTLTPGTGQTVEYAVSLNGDSAPVGGYLNGADGKVFTGLEPNKPYYVWVRTQWGNGYEAGEATLVSSTPTTTNKHVGAVVTWGNNPFTLGDGTSITISTDPTIGTLNGGSQSQIEYVISKDDLTPAGAATLTTWGAAKTFTVASADVGTAHYVYARVVADATHGVGAAVKAEVTPKWAGRTVQWPAQLSAAIEDVYYKGFSVIDEAVTFVGGGNTNNRTQESLQYAVSKTTTAPADNFWEDDSSGFTFADLDEFGTYYVFARAKEEASIQAGPAIRAPYQVGLGKKAGGTVTWATNNADVIIDEILGRGFTVAASQVTNDDAAAQASAQSSTGEVPQDAFQYAVIRRGNTATTAPAAPAANSSDWKDQESDGTAVFTGLLEGDYWLYARSKANTHYEAGPGVAYVSDDDEKWVTLEKAATAADLTSASEAAFAAGAVLTLEDGSGTTNRRLKFVYTGTVLEIENEDEAAQNKLEVAYSFHATTPVEPTTGWQEWLGNAASTPIYFTVPTLTNGKYEVWVRVKATDNYEASTAVGGSDGILTVAIPILTGVSISTPAGGLDLGAVGSKTITAALEPTNAAATITYAWYYKETNDFSATLFTDGDSFGGTNATQVVEVTDATSGANNVGVTDAGTVYIRCVASQNGNKVASTAIGIVFADSR